MNLAPRPGEPYSFLSHLECSRTGERVDADRVQGLSPAGAPLLARYDLAQVREAVEAALPKLRDALEAGGLGLGSASVSDGFARQSGQQDARSGNGGSGRGRGGRFGGGSADDTVATTATVGVRRQVGIVDTFA